MCVLWYGCAPRWCSFRSIRKAQKTMNISRPGRRFCRIGARYAILNLWNAAFYNVHAFSHVPIGAVCQIPIFAASGVNWLRWLDNSSIFSILPRIAERFIKFCIAYTKSIVWAGKMKYRNSLLLQFCMFRLTEHNYFRAFACESQKRYNYRILRVSIAYSQGKTYI